MRSWLRGSLLLGAALLGAAPIAAQSSSFAERSDVVVVEVPVYVSRDGQPVRGLTKDSFAVYDGREKLPIVDFDAIDLATASAQPGTMVTRVPIAARRHFLLLFDTVFSDLGAVVKAREAGLHFVRDQMQPTDVAAVGIYGAGGARLLLGFTSDRQQLDLAVSTLGAPKLVELHPDPFGLTMTSPESVPQTSISHGSGPGAEAHAEVQAEVTANLEALAHVEKGVHRQQSVDQVVALSRSFGELAHRMGQVEGRKYLVLFSAGYDQSLVTGDTSQAAANSTKIEFGATYDISSDEMYGNTHLTNNIDAMLQEFRRADFSIEAIDIARLAAGGDQRASTNGESSLLQMAKDTGGELFRDFNQLDKAVDQLMAKTSVVYLLTVQPTKLKQDGKFHALKVSLVNGPGGAEVHARPGFYAPGGAAKSGAGATEAPLAQALLGGAESGDLDAHLIAAPFPMDAAQSYVPVLVEVGGHSLLDGLEGDKVGAQVFVYAFDARGRVAAYLDKNLTLDVGKVGKALQASGFKYWGHMSLAPGDYDLRMLVRVNETGRSRLSSLQISVPSSGTGIDLAPPLFPEPQGKWLLLADSNRPKVSYPFMMSQQPFIPAAHPLLPREGDTSLQLVAYNLPAGDVSGAAELLASDGKTVVPATLTLGKREQGSQGSTHFAAKLATAGVAAGEYTLVITLNGPDGATQRSVLPVAVGG